MTNIFDVFINRQNFKNFRQNLQTIPFPMNKHLLLALNVTKYSQLSAVTVRFLTKRFISEYSSLNGNNCVSLSLWSTSRRQHILFSLLLLYLPFTDFLYKHTVNFEDNVSADIEILDTCNVSKTVALNLLSKLIEIATLQHSYDHIRWADSFLIVYSIVDRESFYEAERILKQLSKLKLPSYYTSLLLGNKSDLEHSRLV